MYAVMRMRPYPAAVTCLTRAVGCIDLLLDILRIVSGSGIFLSLDNFDIVVERRIVVRFPLHRRLYSSLRFATTSHAEFAVS